jgi:hypothetical protein
MLWRPVVCPPCPRWCVCSLRPQCSSRSSRVRLNSHSMQVSGSAPPVSPASLVLHRSRRSSAFVRAAVSRGLLCFWTLRDTGRPRTAPRRTLERSSPSAGAAEGGAVEAAASETALPTPRPACPCPPPPSSVPACRVVPLKRRPRDGHPRTSRLTKSVCACHRQRWCVSGVMPNPLIAGDGMAVILL